MTRRRLLPHDRKAEILDAALAYAGRPGGWGRLTREAVAFEAGCTEGLVSKYFGTMVNLRRTVMRAAITTSNLSIIAQGLASGDKVALKAEAALKRQSLLTLAD